jgi:hypothetical protein
MNHQFVKPRYDEGGFAGLHQRILADFAGGYQNVILFFVDSLGWRYIDQINEQLFVQNALQNGATLQKLTSQFPSTTSAHTTCIHTGLPPGESGIYEWNMYHAGLDTIITPLLFSYLGATERDQLKKDNIAPESIYPTKTFYQTLKQKGIRSRILQHREYTPSTFSSVVFKGANEVRGFKTPTEVLINLADVVTHDEKPTYTFLYYDKIDSISHEYGPNSPQAVGEIETFFWLMQRYFPRQFAGRKTRFYLTADHGMCETDPKTTIYLNTDARFRGIEQFIATNRAGQMLIPAGSPRDFFLHIKPELLTETQAFLAPKLQGVADVVFVSDLMAQGYFGNTLTETFRANVGNLVILPYRHQSVWWYEKGRLEQKYYGHHGGLTPQEMEIPLLTIDF